MQIIQIIIFAIVLLGIALLGIGFKLIFDRKAHLPATSCGADFKENADMTCGCGTGACGLKTNEPIH
jgi:hypothetical protein